ncbi:nitrophenyl compound nitroreductase subunit ArsF family protein [Ancylomarina sp. YFZ004]
MKKIISIFSIILLMGVVSVSAQCCKKSIAANSTKDKTDCTEVQQINQVKAYYFHATRRCATCQAVETVSKEAIQEYYGNKVSFESINIEKVSDKSLLKKYKISGQTLLIVNGDKTVNLTNAGFLNARTNPDKLKSKIKSTIDSMM